MLRDVCSTRSKEQNGVSFNDVTPDESPSSSCGSGFCNQEAAEDQDVHLGAEKAIERFFRPADDGLVVVEIGVQDDGHAGEIGKLASDTPLPTGVIADYGFA